jgi:small subunit ribosomal protein S16
MVKIRLRRIGANKKPSYRVVVTDSRAPRGGAFISVLGHFDPRTNPETVSIKEEETLKWLKQGAQPTATVARLLSKTGIMEKFKAGKEKT